MRRGLGKAGRRSSASLEPFSFFGPDATALSAELPGNAVHQVERLLAVARPSALRANSAANTASLI